jgi:hypothetical protein
MHVRINSFEIETHLGLRGGNLFVAFGRYEAWVEYPCASRGRKVFEAVREDRERSSTLYLWAGPLHVSVDRPRKTTGATATA